MLYNAGIAVLLRLGKTDINATTPSTNFAPVVRKTC